MKFDPLKIFFFIIVIAVAIIFMMLIANAFFNFKANVKYEERERFNIELSENILTSDLTYGKSVFNAKALNELEKSINAIDSTYHNVEMPFKSCNYGYKIKITGFEQSCVKNNDECRNFCRDVCGLGDEQIKYGDNCKCDKTLLKKIFGGIDCQCKKVGSEDWIDEYEFSFGYEPSDSLYYSLTSLQGISSESHRSYPVAIANVNDAKPSEFYETVYPAIMDVSVYESFLSRTSCLLEKTTLLKEPRDVSALQYGYQCGSGNVKCLGIKKSGEFDNSNHLCVFYFTSSVDIDTLNLAECKYSTLPVIPIMDKYDSSSNYAKVVAYPIKKEQTYQFFKTIDDFYSAGNIKTNDVYTDYCKMSRENCKTIKDNKDFIATGNDESGALLLCIESEKKILC
jgi:hypothetical protein